MARYNAAHRGAEDEVFAHLPSRKPFVLAYTATRWWSLLTPVGDVNADGSDDLVRGISESLRARWPRVEIKTEYLDTKLYHGPAHDQFVLGTLRYKFKGVHFDLLVATDDYAFDVLLQQRDALFGQRPVVFAGTNDFDPARIAQRPDFFGVDERPSFGDTLDALLKLQPDTRRLLAITDNSITGQRNAESLRQAPAVRDGRLQIDWSTGQRFRPDVL